MQVDEFYIRCLKAAGVELISWGQLQENDSYPAPQLLTECLGQNLHRIADLYRWPVLGLRFKMPDMKIIDCTIKREHVTYELLKLLDS